ncbi:hypothetical protein SOVF_067820 [Spinacia oleracea]|uniref:Transmembrane protein n=1 Tax=Spinacia oleracea TaxID=3562 RepID=A0A9R0JYM7_SPIOL|nr:uncharacterized protein LOC110790933 [Spinacia oleracea]KNA18763.1 hypothetical protein SOVF_067820 [Spinacia oleracea]
MPEDELINPTRIHKSKFVLYSNCLCPLLSIFLDSLKIIFLHNPKLFFTLYIFTTLPLSLLLTSASVSAAPRFLKSHIARLEWLEDVVPIWMEAANIRDESRADSSRLLRRKLLHGVPVFVLSLIALVTIVISTHVGLRRKKKVTLKAALSAVKVMWAPPLLTCLVNFIVWVGWGHLDPIVNKFAVHYPPLTAAQVAVEVYMMSVFGLALVVSVVEARAGFEAVWVGWVLMKGRRLCGWVLAGLILLISGFIGKQMIGVINGEDLGIQNGGYTWTVEMRFGSMVGLVVLLGWLLLWSYVIFAVFYFDCRKRNVIREEEQLDILDDDFDL